MERMAAAITRTVIKRLPKSVRRGICSGVYSRISKSTDWAYDGIPPGRVHLWVVSAPKSGSTWVSVVLGEALGYRELYLTSARERQEQQVDGNRLFMDGIGNNIFSSHQHCRYSAYTGDFIKRSNVRILLTIRDVFDTLMSIHDHNERESHACPMYYADRRLWHSLKTKDSRLRFLADTAIPWYVNFYAGWLSNVSRHSDRIAICQYERLIEDPAALLLDRLHAIDVPVSEEAISRGLVTAQNKNTRENKGVAGRGQEIPTDVRDQITRMFRHYSDIDWSIIGIPSSEGDE